MKIRSLPSRMVAGACLLAAATPASAHHLMGGRTPSTFAEGILSGLGHPVIGADHLAILVAVGIVIGAGGLNLAIAAVFVALSAVGVALHVNAVNLPAAEFGVAISVIAAGVLLASGRSIRHGLWALFFAAAGLIHGYAYGESIFGAEPTPLWAYLVGLVAVQSAMTIAVATLARRTKAQLSDINTRLAGATVAGVGVAVLAAQLVPAP